MLSKWKEQINQKNLGRFSSLANVVLFLCMAGLLSSGRKTVHPTHHPCVHPSGAVGRLYPSVFCYEKTVCQLCIVSFIFAAFFTAPFWLR